VNVLVTWLKIEECYKSTIFQKLLAKKKQTKKEIASLVQRAQQNNIFFYFFIQVQKAHRQIKLSTKTNKNTSKKKIHAPMRFFVFFFLFVTQRSQGTTVAANLLLDSADTLDWISGLLFAFLSAIGT